MADYAAAGWLAVIAGYSGWLAMSSGEFAWLLWCIVYLTVATGLVLHRKWATYCAIGLAFVAIVAWILLSANALRTAWPYRDVLSTAVSLAPGLFWIAIWAVVGLTMYKGLKRPS
jgi:hypothetical protein